jgi:hypothetical protein
MAKDIAGQLGLNYKKQHNTSHRFVVEGEYKAHFSQTDKQGRGSVDIHWKNNKRNKMFITVSEQLSYCIRKFMYNHGYRDEFTVTGFTNLKTYEEGCDTSVKYYVNEYMSGHTRYDYAMVKFVAEDNSTNTAPAKVVRFIKHNKTTGIPTPHFSDNLQETLLE